MHDSVLKPARPAEGEDEVERDYSIAERVLMFAATWAGKIFSAWVTCILWRWFVERQFGIATPRLPVVAGLSLIIGLLTYRSAAINTGAKYKATWATVSVDALFIPVLTLGIGWAWAQFM